MSVFAFVLYFALDTALSRRQGDRASTGFLALATVLPAAASVVMALVALIEVGSMCKLCIGVYVASALCLAGGVLLWRRARRDAAMDDWTAAAPPPAIPRDGDPAWVTGEGEPPVAGAFDDPPPVTAPAPVGAGRLALAFFLGVVFVALPVAAYVATAPDHARFVGSCGSLEDRSDPYGTLLPLDPHRGGVPTIEVLDPLCPACRAFDDRLAATGLAGDLDRKAVLFPLDNACNWMVGTAIHPGACTVSEAVLCAGARATDVVAWAFAEQERIRDAAAKDPGAARRLVAARFPEIAGCVGSAEARSRLNKSLRWAVRNQLPVLTPQIYVDGVKLCDEDVDLGLDFALSRMIVAQRRRAAERKAP
jgi:hypothetical protein